MNKTYAKPSLRTVAAMVIFALGLFVAGSVQAQSATASSTTQDQWLAEADAIAVLTNELTTMGQELINLNPGSPEYDNLYLHMTYFAAIVIAIEKGSSTPEAATNGLASAHPYSATKSDVVVSQQQNVDLPALYQEAKDLLTK